MSDQAFPNNFSTLMRRREGELHERLPSKMGRYVKQQNQPEIPQPALPQPEIENCDRPSPMHISFFGPMLKCKDL